MADLRTRHDTAYAVWRACRSKVRHRTRAKALRAASKAAAARHMHLHVYQCQWCNGWHLTSQERRHG